MELRIVPEPTPQERAAIAAALERAADGEARVVAAWVDADLDAPHAPTGVHDDSARRA